MRFVAMDGMRSDTVDRRGGITLVWVVAVAAVVLLAAGCGGGGAPGVANVSSAKSAATTAAAAGGTTTVQYGTSGAVAGALAFARCMRSHGIPDWPDPNSNGGFDKAKLRQLGVPLARIQAIEGRSCNYSFQDGGQGQATTITAADRADYLKAAACIRTHGFATFPDPTFPDDTVNLNIPSTINTDSPKFKHAAATCSKLVPSGLPYSNPNGS